MPSAKPLKHKLLADENIRKQVIQFLRKYNVDIVRSPKGLKNGQVVQWAISQERTILSHDTDFLAYPPSKSRGLVVIRIHPPVDEAVCGALMDLFKKTSPEKLDKRLTVVSKDGFDIQ